MEGSQRDSNLLSQLLQGEVRGAWCEFSGSWHCFNPARLLSFARIAAVNQRLAELGACPVGQDKPWGPRPANGCPVNSH